MKVDVYVAPDFLSHEPGTASGFLSAPTIPPRPLAVVKCGAKRAAVVAMLMTLGIFDLPRRPQDTLF